MARKKVNHALHVKSHTQGFSNELSVSVLDAAREARDARERSSRRPPAAGAGGVSLFTLGRGAKVRSTPEKGQHIVLSEGAAKGLPRSHARRSVSGEPVSAVAVSEKASLRFIPLVVIVCALLALALTVGQTWFQVRDYQQDIHATLADYIKEIDEADSVIIPLDELVMSQYDENSLSKTSTSDTSLLDELVEQYRTLVGDIAPMRAQLDGAISAIESLQPSISDNADAEAARQALVAATSRLDMFDTGVSIIDEALMATEAYEAAEQGWKSIIDADAAARAATDSLREMNEENVRASMEQSNEALSLLNSAADRLVVAQNAYPGLDLGRYLDYVNKRIEAQQAALSSDQAYLDRNKELLEQENERYNALEAEAAALAKDLGGDPSAVVDEFYRAALADPVSQYEDARLKAGNADAFLRDYLGSDAQ